MSANDKGDNEVIPETVHRRPGIYFAVEANLENPFDEDCTINRRLKKGPLHTTSGREKKNRTRG